MQIRNVHHAPVVQVQWDLSFFADILDARNVEPTLRARGLCLDLGQKSFVLVGLRGHHK